MVRIVVVDVLEMMGSEGGIGVVVIVLVVLGVVDFILVKGGTAVGCLESSSVSSSRFGGFLTSCSFGIVGKLSRSLSSPHVSSETQRNIK